MTSPAVGSERFRRDSKKTLGEGYKETVMVPSESNTTADESDSDFVSNPFSSGGGGVRFENQVQASFLAMMLVGGSPPVLFGESIQKIKLQGRYKGFHTDDLIIFTGSTAAGSESPRLLAQIKHKVSFTRSDKLLKQVIKSAWKDWGIQSVLTGIKMLLP